MKKFLEILEKFSKLDENSLNKKNKKNFLETFFTKNEIENFEERIKILEKLNKKETQRKISSDLWISITTVTRWNKVFKIANDEVKKLF